MEPEVSKTDALEEWCEDELESRCLVVLMNIARIENSVHPCHALTVGHLGKASMEKKRFLSGIARIT